VRPAAPHRPGLDEWEGEARRREEEEVAWYENALGRVDDPQTLAILQEILASERHHQEDLAGKWMAASSGDGEECA